MSETTELIKRLRDRGLTQTEIARRTGIPQPRLSRWENGEVPDAADDALKLAALVFAEEAPERSRKLRKPATAPVASPEARLLCVIGDADVLTANAAIAAIERPLCDLRERRGKERRG